MPHVCHIQGIRLKIKARLSLSWPTMLACCLHSVVSFLKDWLTNRTNSYYAPRDMHCSVKYPKHSQLSLYFFLDAYSHMLTMLDCSKNLAT